MIIPHDAEPLPQPPKGWNVTPAQWARMQAEHLAYLIAEEDEADARAESRHRESLRAGSEKV